MPTRKWRPLLAASALLMCRWCRAEHDIEYVAEHLPEVAMDNRYATLPLWGGPSRESSERSATLQGAASFMTVGNISLSGPMLSAALTHTLGRDWQWGVLGFYDRLTFQSERELRPLQTLFAPDTPIDRPVDAMFSNLDGRADHMGTGFFLARASGHYRWVAGILWQQVTLENYRFDYRILAGPQQGLTGHIDFDTTYEHVTPFVGLAVPRDLGLWTLSVHGLLACPLPRRGVVGHINGPHFDLSGDTASAGNGKHFGDASLTLGLNVTYRPARLTVDLGTLVSQALMEPLVHKGIDQNLLLSVSWTY